MYIVVISKITTLDVNNIIRSTKNSSHGCDDIHACVAKKCIDHYIDPYPYNKQLYTGKGYPLN